MDIVSTVFTVFLFIAILCGALLILHRINGQQHVQHSIIIVDEPSPYHNIILEKDADLPKNIAEASDDVRKLRLEYSEMEKQTVFIDKMKTTSIANKRENKMHLRYSNIGAVQIYWNNLILFSYFSAIRSQSGEVEN